MNSEYVLLYFPHNDWAENPGLYTNDYRSAEFNGGEKTWDIEIEVADLPNEEFELTWPDIDDLPPDLQLTLYDVDGYEIGNLQAIDSYSFTSGPEDLQHYQFQIVLSQAAVTDVHGQTDKPVDTFKIVGAHPNPFNEQVRVTVSAPSSGSAQIAIYDMLGREVAMLHDGVLEAGMSDFVWRSEGLASGTYVVRFEQGRNSASQKVTLLR